MHEFTTDILRLQFIEAASPVILSATDTQKVMQLIDEEERSKALTVFRYTLGQALTNAAARNLQIDPRELDFTLRFVPSGAALNTEFILFDTAPGGAGYASKCFDEPDLLQVFANAVRLLRCDCGDSCYGCLRSYSNQWMHARLNRKFVLDGLEKFNEANW